MYLELAFSERGFDDQFIILSENRAFLKHVYEVGVSDMCIFVKLRPTHYTKRSKELSIAFCTNIVNCHTCIQFKVSAH